jgi:hypothetical protein
MGGKFGELENRTRLFIDVMNFGSLFRVFGRFFKSFNCLLHFLEDFQGLQMPSALFTIYSNIQNLAEIAVYNPPFIPIITEFPRIKQPNIQ